MSADRVYLVIGLYQDDQGRFADRFTAQNPDAAEAAAQAATDDGLDIAAVIELSSWNDEADTFTGSIAG